MRSRSRRRGRLRGRLALTSMPLHSRCKILPTQLLSQPKGPQPCDRPATAAEAAKATAITIAIVQVRLVALGWMVGALAAVRASNNSTPIPHQAVPLHVDCTDYDLQRSARLQRSTGPLHLVLLLVTATVARSSLVTQLWHSRNLRWLCNGRHRQQRKCKCKCKQNQMTQLLQCSVRWGFRRIAPLTRLR